MSAIQQPRITPQAAVVAVRAFIGEGCTEETATDIVEIIRPHLEFPYVALVESLRAELMQAREEIVRLSVSENAAI